MGRKVGLWIDHREAHIVTITDKGEEIRLIPSKVEKQTRRSEESRHEGSFEPQQVPADDSQQRTRTGHLNIYYDEITAYIKEAESILIFGPGEAKNELKKHLDKLDLGGCAITVETADKMTDNQIAVYVRDRFAEKHPASA